MHGKSYSDRYPIRASIQRWIAVGSLLYFGLQFIPPITITVGTPAFADGIQRGSGRTEP
jgi:hypothetical protein